jgi:hypothetical protein
LNATRLGTPTDMKAALDAQEWTYYRAREFAINDRYSIYLFDVEDA